METLVAEDSLVSQTKVSGMGVALGPLFFLGRSNCRAWDLVRLEVDPDVDIDSRVVGTVEFSRGLALWQRGSGARNLEVNALFSRFSNNVTRTQLSYH